MRAPSRGLMLDYGSARSSAQCTRCRRYIDLPCWRHVVFREPRPHQSSLTDGDLRNELRRLA